MKYKHILLLTAIMNGCYYKPGFQIKETNNAYNEKHPVIYSEKTPLFKSTTYTSPMSYKELISRNTNVTEQEKKGVETISKDGRLYNAKTNTEIKASDSLWVKTYQINKKKTPFVYYYSPESMDLQRKHELTNKDCINQYYTFNCQSTTFMNADYETNSQYLYPSAIYSLDDFENGDYNLKEVTINRNPIILSTDNPNVANSSYIVINQPNMVNIREGIRELFANFNENGGNMDFKYQIFESNNSVEQQLKISAGGGITYSGIGSTMESTINDKSKQEHHYITVDINKDIFTINSICNNYFTPIQMEDSDLIVINSVTYGLRILANIDITGYENIIERTINLTGNTTIEDAFTAHGHLDLGIIKKALGGQTKVNCYVIGGSTNSSCSFTIDQFETDIKAMVSGVNAKNARPIMYTLSDLNGNIISIRSEIANIRQNHCTDSLTSIIVKWTTLGDDKKWDSQPNVDVFDKNGRWIAHIDCCSSDRDGGSWGLNRIESRYLVLKAGRITMADLIAGHYECYLNRPRGTKDDWEFGAELTFNFSNGESHTISSCSGKNTCIGIW